MISLNLGNDDLCDRSRPAFTRTVHGGYLDLHRAAAWQARESRIAVSDGFHRTEIIVRAHDENPHAVVVGTQRIIPIHMRDASTAGSRRGEAGRFGRLFIRRAAQAKGVPERVFRTQQRLQLGDHTTEALAQVRLGSIAGGFRLSALRDFLVQRRARIAHRGMQRGRESSRHVHVHTFMGGVRGEVELQAVDQAKTLCLRARHARGVVRPASRAPFGGVGFAEELRQALFRVRDEHLRRVVRCIVRGVRGFSQHLAGTIGGLGSAGRVQGWAHHGFRVLFEPDSHFVGMGTVAHIIAECEKAVAFIW